MQINLIPYGGLGNRMRAIASVYQYAIENNHTVVVYWNRQKDFNQSFKNLFKQTDRFKVIDRYIGFINNHPYKANLFLPTLFDAIIRRNSYYFIEEEEFIPIVENAVKKELKEITISTCYQHGKMYPLDKIFKPAHKIQCTIDGLLSEFGEETIGCHIRRTDNIDSIKHSKTDFFIEIIQKHISKQPNNKVFLCTDDTVTKEQLIKKFGNKIITYQSKLNRFTPTGINDAVVELYALAQTNVIYGSYNSSYSDIASKIFGRKLQILQ